MKQIIVNVDDLTIEEKKQVAEALAKSKNIGMCDPRSWDKVGTLYGPSTYGIRVGFNCYEDPNPTHSPQQVLEMAGMKKKGHVHAEQMMQYAEDAKTHSEPWRLWQAKTGKYEWVDCKLSLTWVPHVEYRRKPKTKLIHGVEIPVFEFTPKVGESYFTANVGLPELFENGYRASEGCTFTQRMIERGLIYPYTEEGKQASILHSQAMLGIA